MTRHILDMIRRDRAHLDMLEARDDHYAPLARALVFRRLLDVRAAEGPAVEFYFARHGEETSGDVLITVEVSGPGLLVSQGEADYSTLLKAGDFW